MIDNTLRDSFLELLDIDPVHAVTLYQAFKDKMEFFQMQHAAFSAMNRLCIMYQALLDDRLEYLRRSGGIRENNKRGGGTIIRLNPWQTGWVSDWIHDINNFFS